MKGVSIGVMKCPAILGGIKDANLWSFSGIFPYHSALFG